MKITNSFTLLLSLLATFSAEETSTEPVNNLNTVERNVDLEDTDLVLAFVVFRHGDRTPDEEELALDPSIKVNLTKILFPYGTKALTNRGKRRGYLVGKYLRQRYNGFISSMYLPDEVEVRTTNFDRTKMTVLTALAALYPPPPAQAWNPKLNWQPVPYSSLPANDDDLLYWYNCPKYHWLKDRVNEDPEVKVQLKQYENLFEELTKRTGANITLSEQVFYLDNLYQALENVDLPLPEWVSKLMPSIKEVTKIEYDIENYNIDMIRLAAGVLMSEIINATNLAVAGVLDQPKLRLYSAHENNVANIMAAVRVFKPHQPSYGSTFSLELRRRRTTGEYAVTAVYSPKAGGPETVLPISGCGGKFLCDYDIFLGLVQEVLLTKEDFLKKCKV